MNLISFVDELVKVGGVRCLLKRAADITSSIPDSMMSQSDPVPPAARVVPDEAATRLPHARGVAQIPSGQIGEVGESPRPIDRERLNRTFVERR